MIDATTASHLREAVITDLEGRFDTYSRNEIEAAVDDLWLLIGSNSQDFLDEIADDPVVEARLRENRRWDHS